MRAEWGKVGGNKGKGREREKTQRRRVTQLTRWSRSLDRSQERDPEHQICPPLLAHGEKGRVARLVGVEVVDDDAHKQLETNVDSEEDEDVQENGHVLG